MNQKLSGIIIIFLVATFGGYSWWQSGIEAAVTVKTPTKSGLVGYWSFEEATGTKATDFSGNGNTGTLTSMANPATPTSGWGSGKLGTALNFDGVNDYVGLADVFDFNRTDTRTFSAWIKPSSISPPQSIITKQDLTTPYSGWSVELTDSGKIRFEYIIDATTNKLQVKTTNVVITTDIWQHVVVVYNNQTVTMYVGGQVVPTSVIANTLSGNIDTTIPLNIGNRNNNQGEQFSGSIDEVRIYNRALSQTEITKLYQSGAVKLNVSQNTKLTDGLVGLWSFNGADMNGTTVYDRSGNGNNGTLTNGPTKTSGKIGQALNVDGVNDYVSIPGSRTLTSATFSAWVYRTASTQSYAGIVFSRGTSVSGLDVFSTANKIGYHWNDAANTYNWDSGITIPLNKWALMVVAIEPTQAKAYVYSEDGLFSATNAVAHASSVIDNIKIGQDSFGGRFFPGKIDEVRIYNRALSQNEITKLYQAGVVKINVSQNTKLTDGLVGLWSFNGLDMSSTTAYDRSGQGNNGTLIGLVTKTVGKIGQALSFDGGVYNYVSLASTSALSMNSNFTLSAWIYSGDTSCCRGVISKGSTYSGLVQYRMQVHYAGLSNSEVSFIVGDGTSFVELQSTFNIIKLNTWHHVVCETDTSTMWCYIDGVLRGSASRASIGTSFTGDDFMAIGANNGNQQYFNGKIDEVRIYNRVLSAAEVRQLYNLGR